MARHKVITVDFENKKITLAKKRERIRKTVDAVYVILMLAGILMCGINQSNPLIVGWGMISMGVISLPITIFYLYMENNGWEPLFWYDYSGSRGYIDKQTRKKDLEEHYFVRIITIVALILFTVGLLVCGILRLLGII